MEDKKCGIFTGIFMRNFSQISIIQFYTLFKFAVHMMHFIMSFFWLFGYAGGNGHFEPYWLESMYEKESTNTMYVVYVLAVITV